MKHNILSIYVCDLTKRLKESNFVYAHSILHLVRLYSTYRLFYNCIKSSIASIDWIKLIAFLKKRIPNYIWNWSIIEFFLIENRYRNKKKVFFRIGIRVNWNNYQSIFIRITYKMALLLFTNSHESIDWFDFNMFVSRPIEMDKWVRKGN